MWEEISLPLTPAHFLLSLRVAGASYPSAPARVASSYSCLGCCTPVTIPEATRVRGGSPGCCVCTCGQKLQDWSWEALENSWSGALNQWAFAYSSSPLSHTVTAVLQPPWAPLLCLHPELQGGFPSGTPEGVQCNWGREHRRLWMKKLRVRGLPGLNLHPLNGWLCWLTGPSGPTCLLIGSLPLWQLGGSLNCGWQFPSSYPWVSNFGVAQRSQQAVWSSPY